MGIQHNTGDIRKNEHKTNEKQPSYRGKINVKGTEYNIALFEHKDRFDSTFFKATIS